MKRYHTPLPTLGPLAIDFHKESAEVLEIVGDRELERLRSVAHLGVAASVFTGINHSRLEYTMLQCAVTGLIAKVHKNNEDLALSSKVKLDGIRKEISSGEELLKSWALLSNYGHAQYTYGVERSLLQFAIRDRNFSAWLTTSVPIKGLRKWSKSVIEQYRDGQIHYLISLKRIALLPEWERKRRRYANFVRNLVLPIDLLHIGNPKAQFKLLWLRNLYSRIRLMCIVALDLHYSNQPLGFDLNSAVLGFSDLVTGSTSRGAFDVTMEGMAAWLADELYLHPESVAVQRAYELKAAAKLPTRFKMALTRGSEIGFLKDLLDHGTGRPNVGSLRPIVRLSFDRRWQLGVGSENLDSVLRRIEKDIVRPPVTHVSVDRNRHSDFLHLDLFYDSSKATVRDVVSALCRGQSWLVRALEAHTLQLVRGIVPTDLRIDLRKEEDQLRGIMERITRRRMALVQEPFLSLFGCILRLFLPTDYNYAVSGFVPSVGRRTPFHVRFQFSNGILIDELDSVLAHEIDDNPRSHGRDRIAELRAFKRLADTYSGDGLQISCFESIKIFNPFGQAVDEWDGTIIDIRESELEITILEAKSGRGARAREQSAFKQLANTRDLLRKRFLLPYRRKRLDGEGAYIRFSVPAK